MPRRIYAYRLEVTLPPEADEPDWEPEAYEQVMRERYGIDEYGGGMYQGGMPELEPFRWPARRLSFTQAAAKRRAELLERYGAKVVIRRSLPIEWPEFSTEDDGATS